ncbi:hypothetical protein H1230_09120 [Paenibacillus sp. 19GGS1-52]|uniref:hypothetical protein n=1 Tax=Paenibacillus sp. 19GGS1-52 TaxID=2758563 RepID=UPI001EFB5933|nr:hypothetical protein [Paenibacillus sp. 19GGS1-52]ULO08911.1 hypothetical protein H1230_09120 [Paenibacillus sp. 19GGS1-52]
MFNQNQPEVIFNDGRPLMQSLIGPRIMDLLGTDLEAFEQEAIDYFALGYPGFRIVRFDHPVFYLKDERPLKPYFKDKQRQQR